jgi:hypothetical protein
MTSEMVDANIELCKSIEDCVLRIFDLDSNAVQVRIVLRDTTRVFNRDPAMRSIREAPVLKNRKGGFQ